MSLHVSANHLSDAWIQLLEAVNAKPHGTATHTFLSVAAPQERAHAGVSEVVNRFLRERNKHGINTVANTIFPSRLYNDPGIEWTPELSDEDAQLLDKAASEFYEAYLEALPHLQQVPANRGGTYFSRMISWPGKTTTGVNQLALRIEALRGERRNHRRTANFSDIAVMGEADGAGEGLEEYVVSDNRTRGFPCLVHVEISVRGGLLSVLAVYRHWHLITRGYGNLVGMVRLQEFLCQQTGFAPGELSVIAGHANAERGDYSGRAGVDKVLSDAATALQHSGMVASA